MKHFLVSDDVGTPIYFDHSDGRDGQEMTWDLEQRKEEKLLLLKQWSRRREKHRKELYKELEGSLGFI